MVESLFRSKLHLLQQVAYRHQSQISRCPQIRRCPDHPDQFAGSEAPPSHPQPLLPLHKAGIKLLSRGRLSNVVKCRTVQRQHKVPHVAFSAKLYIAQHVCTEWRMARASSTQVTLQVTVHQAADQGELALPSAACSVTYGKRIKLQITLQMQVKQPSRTCCQAQPALYRARCQT